MTKTQLEMLKDLHLASKQGISGISIRRGDKRALLPLETEDLIYFLSGFGRGDSYSVRLTDKGQEWVTFNFAYAYAHLPHQGQTTYQDQHGSAILTAKETENQYIAEQKAMAEKQYQDYLTRRNIREEEHFNEMNQWFDSQD